MSKNTLITSIPLPSGHEVAVYNPENGECCTAEAFQPDFRQRRGHLWNLSAARVFAASYVARASHSEKDQDTVAKAFGKHLDYLYEKYHRELSTEAEKERKRRDRARSERKTTVFSLHVHCESY